MPVVSIDCERIADWASFHSVCKEAFGFPDFYGENLDAFVDCLTYIDEGDGMSNIVLRDGEVLRIDLLSSNDLFTRSPEILDGLTNAVESINKRFVEDAKSEKIILTKL
jgi:RNAse (barnase) inhibitor barstar